MTRIGATTLAQLIAGAVIALAAGVFTPAAHASCGHGHGRGSIFRSYNPPVRTPCTGPECVKKEQVPARERPAPCTGATCKAPPQMPQRVPAASKLIAPDDRSLPTHTTANAASPFAGWLALAVECAIPRAATSIFHPPR